LPGPYPCAAAPGNAKEPPREQEVAGIAVIVYILAKMLPTNDELKERYASYSNYALLSIIHNRDQYTPQAVEIARAELAGRNITSAEVDRFLDEQEEHRLIAIQLAAISLSFREKAFFFFFWFAPIFLFGPFTIRAFLLSLYHSDNYHPKSHQTQRFAIAGFVSLIAVMFVRLHFGAAPLVCLVLLMMLFFSFLWLENKWTQFTATA